ncbi:hypothetical protein MBM09_11155 [Flaviramulus sp. BrNp1-15]|uniref:hypothetical protein n=1 Tax=Flaviramulus sp. BrNp1-15 TaxID=2916754 RepID=UPI001EE968EE|nr:hypothetical protein [Flaviramulus sp. BrNp1-15]ULC58477.1 hypothetical protein MBM09_11155 [Flaviramulus sp. BrNp1-15]
MKNKCILILFLLFISFSYSQKDSLTKYEQDKYFKYDLIEYDSLRGRYFKDFVRPNRNYPIVNASFEDGYGLAPTFKRKCGKLTLNSDRQDCFKNKFYEILRKKFRPPYDYYKKGTSVFLLIQFTINSEGKIKDIKFHKSNDLKGKVEIELNRVLMNFPEIEPAIRNGVNQSVTYHFPFRVKIW